MIGHDLNLVPVRVRKNLQHTGIAGKSDKRRTPRPEYSYGARFAPQHREAGRSSPGGQAHEASRRAVLLRGHEPVFAPRAEIIRHAIVALPIARPAHTSMMTRNPKMKARVIATRTFAAI